MNLLQMRTLLRRRIGNPTLTAVPDTNLNDHLNNSVTELQDRYKFTQGRGRAKFNTTIGVDKYHVNTLTYTVLKVWDRTNKVRIFKKGPSFVASEDFDGTTQGKPEWYARFDTYIQLIPIPDGVYSIEFWYRRIVAAMASDSDVAALPVAWHRGVVIYATYMYYADEGKDMQKATFALNEFSAWVKDKPVEVHEETEDMDQGVEIPTLSDPQDKRLDFDHED